MTDNTVETPRQKALRKLSFEHGLEIEHLDHYSDSAREDIAEYFYADRWDTDEPGDTPKPVSRFAVVTEAGEFTYVKADWDTLEAAARAAVENINDDLYAESPYEIVDLDSDDRYRPDWTTVQWAKR